MALANDPTYGQDLMFALTWLGFLWWLGTLLLAIALVVAVVGLIRTCGTSAGPGETCDREEHLGRRWDRPEPAPYGEPGDLADLNLRWRFGASG